MKNRCEFCDPTTPVDPEHKPRIVKIGCFCTCQFHRDLAEACISSRPSFVNQRIRQDPIRARAQQLARVILGVVGQPADNRLIFEKAYHLVVDFSEKYSRQQCLPEKAVRSVLKELNLDASKRCIPDSLRTRAERYSRVKAALSDGILQDFLRAINVGKPSLIDQIRAEVIAFVDLYDWRDLGHSGRTHRNRREFHALKEEGLWTPQAVNLRMRQGGRLYPLAGARMLSPDDPTIRVEAPRDLLAKYGGGHNSTINDSVTPPPVVKPRSKATCFEDRLPGSTRSETAGFSPKGHRAVARH